MKPGLNLLLCALVLAAGLTAGCDSGRPLPQLSADCPVTLPSAPELALWQTRMDWNDQGEYPSSAQLEAADLTFRRRIAYAYYFPDVLIPFRSGNTLGLILVGSTGDHLAAAQEVDACTPLVLEGVKPGTTRHSYFFSADPELNYSLLHLAWLTDWALVTYPDDFIVGYDWNSHGQGLGGGI